MYIPIQTLRSHFLLKLFLVRFTYLFRDRDSESCSMGAVLGCMGGREGQAACPPPHQGVALTSADNMLFNHHYGWHEATGQAVWECTECSARFEFFSKQGGAEANITPIQEIAWHCKGHVIHRQDVHFQCNACHTSYRAS